MTKMQKYRSFVSKFFSREGTWNVFKKKDESIELSYVLEPYGPYQVGDDVVDVIFVHGLGGDPYGTWFSRNTTDFWPAWLVADLSKVQIWSLKWPSKGYSFIPSSQASIVEVAQATLQLLDSRELGRRPIIFVCHSMGGILVKQLLHSAATLKNPSWTQLLEKTVGVIFLGTPHTGAALANLVKRVPMLPTMRTHELNRNDSALRQLHTWYRTNAPSLEVKTLTFFETVKTGPILIVDQSSADSSVPGSIPIAIDANHVDICKPASRDEISYLSIKRFVGQLLPRQVFAGPNTAVTRFSDLFKESYLHTSEHRVVFGGRQQQISQLNAWLSAGDAPRRMLVTGPTGRGKSALLVRWLAQLSTQNEAAEWHAVFVPISIRFVTSRASVYYKLLAQELATHLGRNLGVPSSDPEEFYLAEAAALLKTINETGGKVLVVIDGLDEAVGDAFNATIFPSLLRPNLKLLFSARQMAGDSGAEGWKARLNWTGTESTATISLPGLDSDGVRDALVSGGLDPSNLPATLPDRLFQLSQGEPLLVQLYIEDIADLVLRNEEVTLEQLSNVEPGYGPYMERWIEHQESAWSALQDPINRRSIDAALAVLSAAFGPMEKDDFVSLVSELNGEVEPLSAASYIGPIRRFVIGKGTETDGYVLSHPKLGQYLTEEHFLPTKMKSVHEIFLRWGDRVLLAQGANSATSTVAPYLLQHYMHHLQVVGVSLQRCAALMSEVWANSWERFEGGFRGYSMDIRKVIEGVGEIRDWGDSMIEAAAIKLHACLIHSSVRSIGTKFPPQLLRLSLEEEILTWKQASHYIELQPPVNQSQFFSEAFVFIPETERQDALGCIYRTTDVGNRVQFLIKILDAFRAEDREHLVDTIVDLLSAVENTLQVISYKADLVQWRPELADGLLNAANLQCVSHKDFAFYANVYARLAVVLDTLGLPNGRAISIAIQFIEHISDPITQLQVACTIAAHRLPGLQAIAISVAKATRQSVEDKVAQLAARNTSTIDHYLAGVRASNLANQMMLAACEFDDAAYMRSLEKAQTLLSVAADKSEVDGLTSLLPLLRKVCVPAVFENTLALVTKLRSGNNRLHALLGLAKYADVSARKPLVREAMSNARLIEDHVSRTRARIALYGVLPRELREATKAELFTEIGQAGYVVDQAKLLMKLQAFEDEASQAQLREYAFELLHLAFDAQTKIGETINLFADAPEALRKRAFNAGMALLKEGTQIPTLAFQVGHFAEKFGDLWSRDDFEYFLPLLPKDDWTRSLVLPELLPLSIRFGFSSVLNEVKVLARTPNETVQQRTLSGLAPHIGDTDSYAQLFERAWEHVAAFDDRTKRVSDWIELLPLQKTGGFERRHAVRKLAAELPNNGNLLVRLALQASTDLEREDLLRQALASALQESPDSALSSAVRIAGTSTNRETRLDALDLIASQRDVHRSSFLNAVEQIPNVLLEFGGIALVRQVSLNITKIGNIWP